jgi:alpha-1,2-mannosyltransferase
MTHIWQGLRSGAWLTVARARGYSLIVLGLCTVAMAGWVIVSDGVTDLNGKPIGTDFSSFYTAGSMALEGHAADAYDMAAHYARQQQSSAPGHHITRGSIRRFFSLSPPLWLCCPIRPHSSSGRP